MVPAAAAQSDFLCQSGAPYDELDFMLGTWGIETPDGAEVAWITLEKDGQGCVIRENYGVPANGHSGAGVDYWDANANLWRRLIVTSVGTIESFEGQFVGETFVWNGREERADGARVLERVEIKRQGGILKNDIYQSTDNGATWALRVAEIRRRRNLPDR